MVACMPNEFEIIKKHFKKAPKRKDVLLGSGDDCSLILPDTTKALATSTDTLVEGVHFLKTINPTDLGFYALAVNLSDLAAMGATPAFVHASLTMPKVDEVWLEALMQGFFELADQHGVDLIGGNLSEGPLAINLCISGYVDSEKVLRRDHAKPGDSIFVTGQLGLASLAIDMVRNKIPADPAIIKKFYRHQPPIEFAQKLLGKAHSAIDISDGLLADLGHILEGSHCGATLFIDQLPINPMLNTFYSEDQINQITLTGGCEYELCFTVPENAIEDWMYKNATKIGVVEKTLEVRIMAEGKPFELLLEKGYQHFL